jgi:hypothetical protein
LIRALQESTGEVACLCDPVCCGVRRDPQVRRQRCCIRVSKCPEACHTACLEPSCIDRTDALDGRKVIFGAIGRGWR